MAAVSLKKNVSLESASPSEELIKEKNKIYITYDKLGRELKIKVPNFQDNLKFDLYFGNMEAKNKKFYEDAKFALFVKEIDGNIVPFPTTESEILALASRLGDEGISAIFECLNENVISGIEKTEDEEKAALKK